MVYIDIFNLPLYYISFKQDNKLEKHLKDNGFNNINHFEAVDGRKLNAIDLLNDNIISIRVYNDLVYGMEQKIGISSLGAIGCTLSHRKLWKLCIDNNLPYMIIAEDDIEFTKPISEKDINNINKVFNKVNSCFISPQLSMPFYTKNYKKVDKSSRYLYGTHFYIVSNSCARQFYNHSLPIDIATDNYIQNLNNRDIVNVEGYTIATQKKNGSLTQNYNCIKCILPKSPWFYVGLVLFIIFLIVIYIITRKKLSKTRYELESIRSSLRY